MKPPPIHRPRAEVAIRLVCALAIFLAGLEARANDPKPERRYVIARADDPSLQSDPPFELQQVRLDRATRWAAGIIPGGRLELRVPSGAEVLAFSIGASTPSESTTGARFRIRLATQGESESVFDHTLGTGEGGWLDFEVPIPPASDDRGERFLVFTLDPASGKESADSTTGGETPSSPLHGWYGSILFLGSEPPQRAGVSDGRERPNVILISLDTLGAAYVGDAERGLTPSLDRFMGEGFAFERAIAPYPATLASHSSIFSGLQPRHHGRYKGVQAGFESRVSALADAGYFTAALTENAYVGSTHGFALGFDWYDDGWGEGFRAVSGDARTTFGRAQAWLSRYGHERRFFLFLHTYEVHSPYVARTRAARRKLEEIAPDVPRKFLPPREMSRAIIDHNVGVRKMSDDDIAWLEALHRAEVFNLDTVFGRLMKRLGALGLAENTLVIVISDHGELFGEQGRLGHGISLHNKAVHVPLAFRWPGVIAKGRSAAPVELVDVMPTVLDLLGEPIPPGLDGRSLAPLLLGEGPIGARPAFSELLFDPAGCPAEKVEDRLACRVDRYAVQTQRFKMIVSKKPEYEKLFDLVRDPQESVDVSKRYPEVAARLRALLEDYVEEQRDPTASEEAAKQRGVEIDAQTQQRLEALGYIE